MTIITSLKKEYPIMLCKKGTKDILLYKNSYIFQVKEDGELVYFCPSMKKLYNRSGNDVSIEFSDVLEELLRQKVAKAVIGEMCCLKDGRSDFNLFQKRRKPFTFIVFDLIDTTLPFDDRYRILLDEIIDNGIVKVAECFLDGEKLWEEQVIPYGLEGVVAKKRGSLYADGKSENCLKIKNWKEKVIRIVKVEENNESLTGVTADRLRVKIFKDIGYVLKSLKDKGFVDINIQYLEETRNKKLRKIHLKSVLKGDNRYETQ